MPKITVPCAAGGCSRPSRSRGLCPAHYMRWRRTGEASGPIGRPSTKTPNGTPLVERLRMWSEDAPNGCRLWIGHVGASGYGYLRVAGHRNQRLAHRVAWELVNGPVPTGMFLDHMCHNVDLTCFGTADCPHRRCIRVDHLEPVTQRENLMRSQNYRGNVEKAKTHCPQGHPYDEANTRRAYGYRYCKACQRPRPLVT